MANQTKRKTMKKARKNRRMRRTVMGTLSAVLMVSAVIVALIPTPQSKAADDNMPVGLITAATANPDTYIPQYKAYPVYASYDGRFRAAYGSNGADMVGFLVYYNQDVQIAGSSLVIPSQIGACIYAGTINKYVAVTADNKPLYYESQAAVDAVLDADGNVVTDAVDRVMTLCTGDAYASWNGKTLYKMADTLEPSYTLVSGNSALPEPVEADQLIIDIHYIGSDRYDVNVASVSSFAPTNDGQYDSPNIKDENGQNMGVFEGATNFSSLTIPEAILGVGNRAFKGCQIQSVRIENGANCIGNYAFQNCNMLSTVVLTEPTNLKEIGDYAFAGCTVLGSIKIPDQVQKLGNFCFKDCTSLSAANTNGTKDDGNTSLTTIGHGLFYNCRSLGQAVFPNNVSNISDVEYICFGCQAMTYLGLPAGATAGTFKANNVKGCNFLDTVKCASQVLKFECPGSLPHDKNNVPESCTFGRTNLGYNSAFPNEYEVSDQFCILAYKNSEAYTYTQTHNLAFGYLDVTNLGEYERTVDGSAFRVNEQNELVGYEVKEGNGKNIIIPDNIAKCHVSSIMASTFKDNTNVEYLYIPESVRTIDAGAFRGCTSLRTVNFDNALAVQEIGMDAFKIGVSEKDMSVSSNDGSPYSGLNFIGTISSASKPFQYAMNKDNNFNSTGAPTQYITYCSQFPQNLQIEMVIEKNPNTNEIVSAVPRLVGIPTEAQLKNPELYSLSTYTGTSDYVRTRAEENQIVASAYRKYQANLAAPGSEVLTEDEQAVIDAVYHVHVPDGVLSLKDDLFKDNTAVQSVILETVKDIPDNEFEGCKNMNTFYMRSGGNAGGESVGDEAFKGCDKLMDVALPATLSDFGSVPFTGCENLTSVDFSGSTKYNCSDGLICSLDENGARSAVLECLVTRGKMVGAAKVSASELEGVTSIAPRAFQNCTGVREAYLDDSRITVVPDYCFDGATNLYYCSLPETAKKIGKYAFRNTSLSTAYIPGSVQSIDDSAFVVGDPGDGSYIQGLTVQCEEDSTAYWYCEDKDGITAETFVKEYTVTFLDYDDYVLKTESVRRGASATAPRVQRAGYTLTGWTEKFDNVKEDITTKAIYEEDHAAPIEGYCSVIFEDYDGLYVWDTQYLKEGDYPTKPEVTPYRKGYLFSYWSPSNYQTIAVSGSMIVKAYYTEDPNAGTGNDDPVGKDPDTKKNIYQVAFVDHDGSVLDTQQVVEGQNPKATSVVPSRDGYIFTTWSPSNYTEIPVTGNMTITALYQKGEGSSGGNNGGNNNGNNGGGSSGGDGDIISDTSNNPGGSTNNGGTPGSNVVNGNPQNVNNGGGSNVNSGTVSGNSGAGNRTPVKTNSGTRVEVSKSGISNRDLVTATVSGSNDNFVVKITDSEEARSAVEQALLKEYGSLDDLKFFAMDISLYDSTGTTKIQNTSGISVTITMPLPDALAGYAGNNKAGAVNNSAFEKLDSRLITIDNVPCISFVAKHFSPYTIYVETNHLTAANATDATPKTGDPIHPKWFLSIGLALLSILMFLGKGSKNRIVKVIE